LLFFANFFLQISKRVLEQRKKMGEEDLEQLEGDILDSLEDIGYDKVILKF
jgi:hypothetical protein